MKNCEQCTHFCNMGVTPVDVAGKEFTPLKPHECRRLPNVKLIAIEERKDGLCGPTAKYWKEKK